MNKVATMSLAGAGGLFLFSVAYIGFAKMNGVPMHTLPVFGSLFPAPPEEEGAHGDEHASEGAEHSTEGAADSTGTEAHETHGEVAGGETHGSKTTPAGTHASSKSNKSREATADLLGSFKFDSPYTSDELRELVETLEKKNAELDRRMAELATKEELADDRLEAIEDRQKALDAMKTELEELQAELAARAEELQDETEKKTEVEQKSIKALGAMFEDGELDALASRLTTYGPKEAAKILVTLTPERAKELLDALPQAKWREFAEAYTKALAAKTAK
ncbi:MAG: hypothetical protein L6Q99_05910 [Planctomycetes bacterium]|nr:hypothetical protein [Planctomycetota bacterium]